MNRRKSLKKLDAKPKRQRKKILKPKTEPKVVRPRGGFRPGSGRPMSKVKKIPITFGVSAILLDKFKAEENRSELLRGLLIQFFHEFDEAKLAGKTSVELEPSHYVTPQTVRMDPILKGRLDRIGYRNRTALLNTVLMRYYFRTKIKFV